MALDPAISLASQAPKPTSPFALLGEVMNMREQAQRVAEGDERLQQTQTALVDDKAIRDTVQKHFNILAAQQRAASGAGGGAPTPPAGPGGPSPALIPNATPGATPTPIPNAASGATPTPIPNVNMSGPGPGGPSPYTPGPDGNVDMNKMPAPDSVVWDHILYDLNMQGRPGAAAKLQDKLTEWNKSRIDDMSKMASTAKENLDTATRAMYGVIDDASLARAIPLIRSLTTDSLADQISASFPGGKFDPAIRDEWVDKGNTAASRIEAQKLNWEQSRALIQDTKDAQKDARQWQTEFPTLVGRWNDVISHEFADAGSQGDWDAAIRRTQQAMIGMPLDLRNAVQGSIPTQYSPDAKTYMRHLGMSQAQISEEAGRAAELTEKEQARKANEDVPMTDDAINMAAEMYAKTGNMGPMGFGPSSRNDRNTIKNRAAAVYKGLDMAAQQAAFVANRASLTGLQKNLDAVTTFENTGLKNTSMLLTTAAKVVDSGSPLLNKPLRSFSDSVLGSKAMAAYLTARQSVIPEFARIMSQPNLTGQLTDEARNKLDLALKSDATLGQIYDAAKILWQDAENRRTSTQDQINTIKDRIATPPGSQAAPPTNPKNKDYWVHPDGSVGQWNATQNMWQLVMPPTIVR